MDFDRPEALLLLLPGVALILAGLWRSRPPIAPSRRSGALAARLAVFVLAVAGLASPRLPIGPPSPRPIVYLVDVSDSVPLAAREAAIRHIARLARMAEPRAEQWVVAFAGGARARRLGDPDRVEQDAELREWLLLPAAEAEARRDLEQRAKPNASPSSSSGPEASLKRIAALRQALDPGQTDLRAALRCLGGLPVSGRAPALVLFTDGRLTRPFDIRGWHALQKLAGTIAIGDTGGIDPGIEVESLSAPPYADAGQPFDAIVRFRAQGGESARIRLLVDDVPSGSTPHRCVPGSNVVTLPRLLLEGQGPHRLKVIVESPDDPEPRNNMGLALVHVGAAPEVLLVEGRRGLAAHLESALQVQGIRTERVDPARLPDRLEALKRFGAVGLIGVPSDQVTDAATEALLAASENEGLGILFAGGPHLAGEKSWRGRPAERLLPVTFDPYAPPTPPGHGPPATPDPSPPADTPSSPKPAAVEASAISLCLLIDKSGSMAGDNIRLAREAAIAAAETLEAGDTVSVVAFDVEPRLVLEPTAASRKDFIRDRIARIQADGGTHVYPALQAAYRLLRNDPAQARHAIVMSDGITQVADYRSLLNQMRADRITVSTVCVAADLTFDWTLMHNLAVWGGGRFYPALSFNEVPQIFTKETRVLVDGRARERAERERREKARVYASPPSTPPPSKPAAQAPPEIPLRITSDDEALTGLGNEPPPPVRGLLPATPRPASVTGVAAREDNRPALVLGRSGLGHTAAWLSDWSDEWGRPWLAWERFPAFSAQLVRSLLRRGPAIPFPGLVSAEIRGDRTEVSVDFRMAASQGSGRFTAQAEWRLENGAEHPIPLQQSAPFIVTGFFPAPPVGEASTLRVRLTDGNRTWAAPPLSVARAVPEELSGTIPTAFAEAADAGIPPATPMDAVSLPPDPSAPTDARSLPVGDLLLAAALFLLPVDIALRRLRI